MEKNQEVLSDYDSQRKAAVKVAESFYFYANISEHKEDIEQYHDIIKQFLSNGVFEDGVLWFKRVNFLNKLYNDPNFEYKKNIRISKFLKKRRSEIQI